MKFYLLLIVLCTFVMTSANASQQIRVQAGDTEALIAAINQANGSELGATIIITPGKGGESEFLFTEPFSGSDSALPTITRHVTFLNETGQRVTFRATGNDASTFRFARISIASDLTGVFFPAGQRSGWAIEGFGTTEGDGGAILLENGFLNGKYIRFSNNFAGGNGGAVAVTGDSHLLLMESEFMENRCANVGGAVSIQDSASGNIQETSFRHNNAAVFGCDVNVNSESKRESALFGNIFDSDCGNVLIDNPMGRIITGYNTLNNRENGADSTAGIRLFANLFNMDQGGSLQPERIDRPPSKTQAMCNDFGSGAFESMGYNIAADDSCDLDQDTDLPATDPLLERDANGLLVPQPGSPAIDSGPTDVIVFEGDELASLPCGYRDLSGTGRPQDANGDGVFECDRGAMEVPGAGDIVNGHSAAFFNPLRNGEGNFVEILSDTLAVVYTFTFRPDGSGPAWFIGVGDINGNSIVIDDLLRPVGTSFGDGFDKDEVVSTPVGGMSMVFADCEAADPGGNIAYSGDVDLGYEGLISRATRLTNVTGCGALTPAAKAGLSGSFFDPARNGEGVIVQWLPNGDVLVIMFTYDQDDNQMWLIGTGTPDGNTVTIDAVYPTTSTGWGRGFKAEDIILSDWGTLTLTWTACNALTFSYASLIEAFGAATRDYVRLSTLSGTACPEF